MDEKYKKIFLNCNIERFLVFMMQKSTNGWLNKDDFISKIDFIFNDTFTPGKNSYCIKSIR